jgi:hypothetical protein
MVLLGFFKDMVDYPWIILAEVCKLKYSIKKLGEKIHYVIKQKQYILLLSRLMCKKKMFEQKRFAGRHLLTFESQKLNYFGEKVGLAF